MFIRICCIFVVLCVLYGCCCIACDCELLMYVLCMRCMASVRHVCVAYRLCMFCVVVMLL